VIGFFSMVDRRKRLHRDIVDTDPDTRTGLAATSIPALSVIEQMATRREPVTYFQPTGAIAHRYRNLWDEAVAHER
jgi:hypothetical protein